MSSRCCAEDPSDEGTLPVDGNVTIKHQKVQTSAVKVDYAMHVLLSLLVGETHALGIFE